MNKLTPFHLAIPVDNIPVCRKFYREVIGCEEGRSSDHWVDFNLFGHQLVIHYKEKLNDEIHKNSVDGKNVASIKSGPSFFKIIGLPDGEFPPLAGFSEAKEYKIPQAIFRNALKKTSYAISTDETRYVLNGIFSSFKEAN